MSCMLMHSGFSLSAENEENGNCVQSHSVNNNTSNVTNGESKQTVLDSDCEYDMIFENMQVVNNEEDKKSIKRKQKISSDKKTVTNLI